MKKTFNKIASFAVATAMVFGVNVVAANAANAANASDNMTRQKISEASDHVIQFDLPTALANGETITITFPNGANQFTGTAATGSAGWAAGPGANQVTYTSTGDAADTTYNVTVTGLINPDTAGNQVIAIAADNGDTGEITVPIIADDQIQVTARVNQVLFFDVRDGITGTATNNTVGFGDLDSTNVRYATDDATGTTTEAASSELEAGTNAQGGYIIDVTGETLVAMDGSGNDIDGLFTPTAAPAAGTEAFGLKAAKTQASTGTDQGTVTGDYDGTFHLPDSGVTDTLASNPGPSSNEIYDITYVANIDAFTPAGNYTTALTYTMTATF
ncbi:MAG: hypothetical protein MRY57_03440 [Candidatus Pacebacteria bacterium]|nr:hypothetical protein [Candidatus Paceibacterota bacterium]